MAPVLLALSGTPCTGKTTLSVELSKALGFDLIHLGEFISEKGLSDGFDEGRDTRLVDVNKLSLAVEEEASGRDVLVEGLMSHMLPVTHAIVLRASPLVLRGRMAARGYSREKIMENLEAEYLGIILCEALENCGNVLELDSAKKVNFRKVASWLKSGGVKVRNVDWSKEFIKVLEG
ncbi:MAG: adenylate kinase family protein [Candidatus Altiarchaeota archaeon]|nr:adenylate kinase family protein [Candidatus Altiarchaeota archaeon]